MYAVIDIGSNTMRLSVYSLHNNEIKPMFHRKNTASLISYVDQKGCMSEQGINKALSVLLGFKKIIDNARIRRVLVFATASLRNICNRQQVTDVIAEVTGFDVNVISGDEEGICAFIGATYSVDIASGLLVDIGGGSTEFVFYKDKKILRTYSIPMGSLNLYANFVSGLIPKKDELKKMRKYIREQLQSVEKGEAVSITLCGVGGTSRAACKLGNDYFNFPLANRSLEPGHIKQLLKSFYHDEDGVDRILRVAPERIHTIIPGLVLLRTIIKHYHCEKITVSEYGVREGYLVKTVIGWDHGE